MVRIFKWLTEEGGSPKASAYTSWFASMFEPKNFEGIDRLLMCYIKYCAKLSIVPKKAYLNAYLNVDGKGDVRKYNIKTDSMSSFDYKETSQLEEAYRQIREIVTSAYEDYVAADLTERDFKVDMYDFMSSMKSESIQSAMMRAYPKLHDGSNLNEVSADLRSDLAELDRVYDTDKISNIGFTQEGNEDTQLELICKTGIPCIDGDCGGIYTRTLTTLTGQPKSGKTRLVLVHWVYQVLTVAKKDVIMYELELTSMQVKNILIAYHITRVYGGRVKIPDSLMNRKGEMSPEQQQIYESAKIDLFESGKYGRLKVVTELVVESMDDEVRREIKESGNCALVVYDYMGIIQSKPVDRWAKRLDKWQIITDAYEISKRITNDCNVATVSLNQFTEDGISAAESGKVIRPGHIQGGQVVQRHTDYDIVMCYTEEQKLAKVRTMSCGYSRISAGFNNALMSVDLSVSIFRQEVQR